MGKKKVLSDTCFSERPPEEELRELVGVAAPQKPPQLSPPSSSIRVLIPTQCTIAHSFSIKEALLTPYYIAITHFFLRRIIFLLRNKQQ